MRAEINCQNLEKALVSGCSGRAFLPVNAEEVCEFVLEAYNELLAKIYLAEAEVLGFFTFFSDTGDGELELKGISDLMDAISQGYCSLKEVVDSAINALRFKSGNFLVQFDGVRIKIAEGKSFKTSTGLSLRVKDFLILRQEFFKRLVGLALFEESFLAKILCLIEPKMTVREFLAAFVQGKSPDILGAYLFLFFCVEGISGIKKNWIF